VCRGVCRVWRVSCVWRVVCVVCRCVSQDRVPQDEPIAEEEAVLVDDGGDVEDEHRHAGHEGQRELRVDVKEEQRGLVPGERRTSLVEPARRPSPAVSTKLGRGGGLWALTGRVPEVEEKPQDVNALKFAGALDRDLGVVEPDDHQRRPVVHQPPYKLKRQHTQHTTHTTQHNTPEHSTTSTRAHAREDSEEGTRRVRKR